MWSIKVCNDNFGATDWKGYNRILLHNGRIIASLANMNDYYLNEMDDEELLYTMCHEMGHGLGLKHSDKDFYNKDLYNCMDYTHKHKNNMRPGNVHYKALKDMYGRVGGGGRKLSLNVLGDKNMKEEEETFILKDFDKYAAHLSGPVNISSQKSNHDSQEKRMLRKTDTAEYQEIQQVVLGDGYSLHTNVLLA